MTTCRFSSVSPRLSGHEPAVAVGTRGHIRSTSHVDARPRTVAPKPVSTDFANDVDGVDERAPRENAGVTPPSSNFSKSRRDGVPVEVSVTLSNRPDPVLRRAPGAKPP
ncbi:hypothetical protein DJ71_13030 [Halorubrum sp. E3]|nr:hypothetical protein DJ71_13030 [Halorubrum sp. E3]